MNYIFTAGLRAAVAALAKGQGLAVAMDENVLGRRQWSVARLWQAATGLLPSPMPALKSWLRHPLSKAHSPAFAS